MEVEVLATLLGVALAALVAACGAGFRWMRSDFRDLRSHVDNRFAEQAATTNARFDRLEDRFDRLDDRFDRLEARFDELIMVLARAGSLIDPQPAAPQRAPLLPGSQPVPQPPDQASAPNPAPTDNPVPTETPPEIADPPRAPPVSGGQPSADQAGRRLPPEPFEPTAAHA